MSVSLNCVGGVTTVTAAGYYCKEKCDFFVFRLNGENGVEGIDLWSSSDISNIYAREGSGGEFSKEIT